MLQTAFANLPAPESKYGLVRTLLSVVLYVALAVGAVIYLLWKLPRHEGGESGDGKRKEPPEQTGTDAH